MEYIVEFTRVFSSLLIFVDRSTSRTRQDSITFAPNRRTWKSTNLQIHRLSRIGRMHGLAKGCIQITHPSWTIAFTVIQWTGMQYSVAVSLSKIISRIKSDDILLLACARNFLQLSNNSNNETIVSSGVALRMFKVKTRPGIFILIVQA